MDPSPAYHSILVGINTYSDRPLEGCVRDARAMKSYLEGLHPSIYTYILTSDHLDDQPRPEEGKATYDNVKSAIECVGHHAKREDRVYIQFSGHGTHCQASRNYGIAVTGDLALDLLSNDDHKKVTYLYGHILAAMLKSIVTKGVIITLVLDCCFSGSVVRDAMFDATPRYLEFDHSIAVQSPGFSDIVSASAEGGSFRDGSFLPNWIVHPKGFTVLAACGPHEKAWELRFDNGKKNGALSFYLRQILSKMKNADFHYQHLYAQICNALSQEGVPQSPILYGDPDRIFFLDPSRTKKETMLRSLKKDSQRGLILPMGEAHGVCVGDDFELQPYFPENLAAYKGSRIVAQAVTVGPLITVLENQRQSMDASDIKPGWTAVPITRRPLRVMTCHFVDNDAAKPATDDLRKRSSLLFPAQDQVLLLPCFVLSQTTTGAIEILNKHVPQRIEIPCHPNADQDGIHLANVLEHLEKFEQNKHLCPKTSSDELERAFDIRLLMPNQKVLTNSGVAQVREGDRLRLEVVNKSHYTLYLHLYVFASRFQVDNIQKATYEVLPPKNKKESYSGIFSRLLKTVVPDALIEQGEKRCQDHYKLIVTSHPTSFQHLEMSPLFGPDGNSETRPGVRIGDGKVPTFSESWTVRDFLLLTTRQ